MTGQATARRAGPAWAGWAIGVPMNLALGLAGYYPVLSLWLLGTVVVQEWGWTPYDSDLVEEGFAPVVLLAAVLWVVFLPVVVGLNHVVTRVTAVRRLPYRLAAALLVATPFGWELITSA